MHGSCESEFLNDMFDSAATRSEGRTACLSAWPRAERVPRMPWIAMLRSRVKNDNVDYLKHQNMVYPDYSHAQYGGQMWTP